MTDRNAAVVEVALSEVGSHLIEHLREAIAHRLRSEFEKSDLARFLHCRWKVITARPGLAPVQVGGEVANTHSSLSRVGLVWKGLTHETIEILAKIDECNKSPPPRAGTRNDREC